MNRPLTNPFSPRNIGKIPDTVLVQNLTAWPASGLWKTAVESLDAETKGNLDFQQEDKSTILEDVLNIVREKKGLYSKIDWNSREGGKEIEIRINLTKVSNWVNKFKEVGDVAVQDDIAYTVLPWAGVRFLLHATVNDTPAFEAMVGGTKFVCDAIASCTIFEEQFLRPRMTWENADEMKNQLAQAIVKLYIAILKYISRAKQYCGRASAEWPVESNLHTLELESILDGYIAKIKKEMGLVSECFDNLNVREIRSLTSTISTGLDITTGAETLVQRPPARHEHVPTQRSDSNATARAIPFPRQPVPPNPHCKMCNIIFYLWISAAVISLAIGLWRSFATSDEGKGFTDAAYIVAVGGLVIYPIQNRHALKCRLNKN